MEHDDGNERPFALLTRVRCLECGSVYSRPRRARTAVHGAGWPQCGYAGWIPASVDVTPPPDAQPSRSAAGLRRLRGGRRR
jgi:hypothetical protein